MKKNYLIITTICLLLSGGIGAQVTIGSGKKPVPGALLDLKEDKTLTGNATAEKGLGLPRVKLDDVAKLKMSGSEILDIDNGGDQYTKHTGLVVYNISGITPAKCAPIPDGLYVWDGAKWNGINVTKADPATLNLSGASSYYLPSGRDARPLTAETFTVDWTPIDKPVAYTNVAHATFGGVSFSAGNITASPLTTSPTTFSLLPDAMTASDIATNPFLTKQNTLTFKVENECGADILEVRVVNQTNKALTVSTPFKEYIASAPNTTNTLTTNANWKLASIMPADATNAISNVRVGSPATSLPTNTTQTGYEQNNNTAKAATLTYDIAVNSTRSRYSTLTFADASATKRFSDVTITVLQCTNVGLNPTIEQWALTAGFTQIQIDAVKTTGADSPILHTGIQLHRDQSSNLFLSSSFHSTNITGTTNTDRWMIHNLAATKFDAGQAYTGGATLIGKGLRPYDADGVPPGTAAATINANAYKNPYYAYPNGGTNNGSMTATTYNNNPRLGLLYTWDAATAGKGGTTGQTSFTDGEPVTHTAVQGICPDGWHLPSDVEWTTLEQELATNTSRYSSTPNVGGTIAIGGTSYRGTTHGKAMKEICEPYTLTHQGTSNGITSDRPGFDLLLAGYAYSGSAYDFGTYGYLWSASGNGAYGAWYRVVHSGISQVSRGANYRYDLFSVRCKK